MLQIVTVLVLRNSFGLVLRKSIENTRLRRWQLPSSICIHDMNGSYNDIFQSLTWWVTYLCELLVMPCKFYSWRCKHLLSIRNIFASEFCFQDDTSFLYRLLQQDLQKFLNYFSCCCHDIHVLVTLNWSWHLRQKIFINVFRITAQDSFLQKFLIITKSWISAFTNYVNGKASKIRCKSHEQHHTIIKCGSAMMVWKSSRNQQLLAIIRHL